MLSHRKTVESCTAGNMKNLARDFFTVQPELFSVGRIHDQL